VIRTGRRRRSLDEEWRFIHRGYLMVYVLLVVAGVLIVFSILPLGAR